MNGQTQTQVDGYLQTLENIRRRVGDDHLAIAVLQEVAKDSRMEQIRAERAGNNSEPATEGQIQFLKKLGVSIPGHLSKQEASALIDEARAKEGI